MFNKIKYSFFAFAAFAVLLTSCQKEEVLELRPEFATDALSHPSSMAEVEQVLLGAYAGFRNANYFGSGSGTGAGWSLMPDVMSDNLYEAIESLANSRNMADFTYDASTGQVASFYQAPYAVIASANIVLRDIDKFTTAANQKMANRLKGQALAIRAFAHFNLMQYFAVRFDRNSNDLVLPYIKTFIVSAEAKPARITNKDYYDNIFADLTGAATLLTDVDKAINPAGVTRPFIDLTVVNAMQARAYLYAGMWNEAITAATNVINARPLVSLDQNTFSGMYNQTALGEIVWNVQFESGQGGPTFLVYFATNQRSYFRPAFEVANANGVTGLIKANDIRYNAYFTNIGGGLALTKYRGKGTVSDGNANFPVFRTGEMYLIRAEARARSNQEPQALADLNALRAARIVGYIPAVALSGNALLQEIANERRAELIGEGHRFFDLKRTTRTLTRGSTCGNNAISVAGTCSLAPDAREWVLPIPATVRNPNPNLTQNPGY